jgi:tetratricopeptide (TPR) repeat protein
MQARLEAELELGINLLDQAKCCNDQTESTKRGELFKKARETLEKLSKRDTKNPVCWQALAWVGRCYQENEDPKGARKIYNDVIAENNEAAEDARRLARYFRMATLFDDTNPQRSLGVMRNAGEEWLNVFYPGYVNTPEGYGVRYELANTILEQARRAPRQSAQARGLFEQAEKLFQGLEQSENDYTALARERRFQIILTVSQERTRGDISKLKDFEECFLRAQLEIARMGEDGKKLQGQTLEDKRKEHYKNIVEALERGLDLADSKSSADDMSEARYLLTYAFLSLGDNYRAAVAGEDLARTEPRFMRAPLAGAYAVQAYSYLLSQQDDSTENKADLEPLRNRLRNLAQYIEQRWPSDSAADLARHLLGWMLTTEMNYAEAVAVLERIGPTYTDSTRAILQLAEAALKAQEAAGEKPQPGQRSYADRALLALVRLPDLSPGADPDSIKLYVQARLIQAGLYYTTKQFDKMEALTDALLKKLDEVDPMTAAGQRVGVLIRALYAKLGRAEVEYNAGQYAKTRALLDPLVNQIKDPSQAGQLSQLKEKDPQLVRAVLGLDLRASVQDNLTDRGREILDLLQKTFPENSLDILVLFVKQLNLQIQQLKAQGESAQGKLDKTVKSFSAFLDVLAKQQDKKPNPELLLFLAQSYSTLDNHGKAAELASKTEEPQPEGDKKEIDPRKLQFYYLGRLLLVRELRLGQEFAKADLVLKEILGSKWGARNLDALKERVLLLEDQAKYVMPKNEGAIKGWENLLRTLQPRMTDNKIKEHYFDCYYHYTLCLYRYGLTAKDTKQRQRALSSAVKWIVRLESHEDPAAEGCKKRFEELLAKEATLKAEYDEFKKNSSR